MKETIILAPGLNGNELMCNLALHGINCFAVRIVNAGELARLALMRAGIHVDEDFISVREEAALAAEAVKGEDYFKSPSYSDIKEISGAIRRMRSFIVDKNEDAKIEEILNKGTFPEKNQALLSVYRKYMILLSKSKKIDRASLLRKAINECGVMKADFLKLSECVLNPLETKLCDVLSGGKIREISLRELLKLNETTVKIEAYRNCYGAPNETETIISDIYKKQRPLDKCTVAVADKETYAGLFFEYAVLYNIPVTFGCGIPITKSNPATLLSAYNKWRTTGFFSGTAVKELLCCEGFDHSKLEFSEFKDNEYEIKFKWDEMYKLLGKIRFTDIFQENEKKLQKYKNVLSYEEKNVNRNDREACKKLEKKKQYLPCLEETARILSKPVEEFVRGFAYIRKENGLLMSLDLSAVRLIYEELKSVRSFDYVLDPNDIIENILGRFVCRQGSKEGCLYITDIKNAVTSVRDNLYIAGLSASKYPGTPKENYLLLDSDLEEFKAQYMISQRRILQKGKDLFNLVELAGSLNSNVSVSYAGMNVSELKNENASSLIYELLKEEKGEGVTAAEMEKIFTKVDFFAPEISAARLIGNAYIDKDTDIFDPEIKTSEIRVKGNLDRPYSPSALDKFFECQRGFMLKYVLGIPEPDEEDTFEIISAADKGTLAHSLMEELANSDMSKEEFLNSSRECFDHFIKDNPPLIEERIYSAESKFLDMMETAYEMERSSHKEVVISEGKIECIHESGIKLEGRVDRVEKSEDGTYRIVDFKSGSKLKHYKDDIESCLQVVLYSYMLENRKDDPLKISGGEYRYINLGKTVTCKYDEQIKAELNSKLKGFKHSMETGIFVIPEGVLDGSDKETCKYCKYGFICGKKEEGEMIND